MAKNLQEWDRTGRDPEYLKVGDFITEELAWEVIKDCTSGDYLDGCLDEEFEIVQGDIIVDAIAGKGLFETIYRESPEHPWQYLGLCKKDEDRNYAPEHAKKIYLCSKYRAENGIQLVKNIQDAIYGCQAILKKGNIPVAPHLYWPRILSDNDYEEREFGLNIGLAALEGCDGIVVLIRAEGLDSEWISEGMQREINAAVKMGLNPEFVYLMSKER